MKETVTIRVLEPIAQTIMDDYHQDVIDEVSEYLCFSARRGDLFVRIYRSHRETLTVSFSGSNALEVASQYDPNATLTKARPKVETEWLDFSPQIGSDEVGVGDFFGPVVVAAALFKPQDLKYLDALGINDSKKISDAKIREIGPTLMKHFPHVLLVCSNDKYNEMHEKGFNMNKIKAWLHNHALFKLKQKVARPVMVYLDQFCTPKIYYNYLHDAPQIVGDIHFATKAESHYPCVAIASCIARYAFLTQMEQIEKEIGMTIPLGASAKVTNQARLIRQHIGEEAFQHLIKKHFKNFHELEEL